MFNKKASHYAFWTKHFGQKNKVLSLVFWTENLSQKISFVNVEEVERKIVEQFHTILKKLDASTNKRLAEELYIERSILKKINVSFVVYFCFGQYSFRLNHIYIYIHTQNKVNPESTAQEICKLYHWYWSLCYKMHAHRYRYYFFYLNELDHRTLRNIFHLKFHIL